MKESLNYFVFNKCSDYLRGTSENLEFDGSRIKIRDVNKITGFFFSRLLDSREKKNSWHRMTVSGSSCGEAAVALSIYASESLSVSFQGITCSLEEVLNHEEYSIRDLEEISRPYLIKEVNDPHDCLLHEIEARYLWIQIRLTALQNQSPVIHKIKIYFPKQSWMPYLPEIYQQDPVSRSFLERFLGIFQSLHEDLSEKIRQFPGLLDTDGVQGEYLSWLAGWIGLEENNIWNEEQLRYLIKNSMSLYRIRGTREYMGTMLRLYTGRTPYFVEHQQIEPFCEDKRAAQRLIRLYGSSPYVFTIVIDPGRTKMETNFRVLETIVEEEKPAHMESNVVVLKPYIFLDRYSYLGINSVLGEYQNLKLDGQASIPFAKLASPKEREKNCSNK